MSVKAGTDILTVLEEELGKMKLLTKIDWEGDEEKEEEICWEMMEVVGLEKGSHCRAAEILRPIRGCFRIRFLGGRPIDVRPATSDDVG